MSYYKYYSTEILKGAALFGDLAEDIYAAILPYLQGQTIVQVHCDGPSYWFYVNPESGPCQAFRFMNFDTSLAFVDGKNAIILRMIEPKKTVEEKVITSLDCDTEIILRKRKHTKWEMNATERDAFFARFKGALPADTYLCYDVVYGRVSEWSAAIVRDHKVLLRLLHAGYLNVAQVDRLLSLDAKYNVYRNLADPETIVIICDDWRTTALKLTLSEYMFAKLC